MYLPYVDHTLYVEKANTKPYTIFKDIKKVIKHVGLDPCDKQSLSETTNIHHGGKPLLSWYKQCAIDHSTAQTLVFFCLPR